MPYVKHEDGFEAAHANHNGSNSTLGGFDQLVRCRGHFPDPTPCDHVLYAWVPDEDVCPNCAVVTEEEYDDFHDDRVEHIYVNHFIPAIEAKVNGLKREHTDAGENIVQMEREKGRINAKAEDVLSNSEMIARLHKRRHDIGFEREHVERLLAEHKEELEQVRRDRAAKGDSVRRRRLRQQGTSIGRDGQ